MGPRAVLVAAVVASTLILSGAAVYARHLVQSAKKKADTIEEGARQVAARTLNEWREANSLVASIAKVLSEMRQGRGG